MNGCLFKTLLILTAIVGIFIGYPYVKEYMSDSMQSKIFNLETQGTIVKKFAKQVLSDQIADKVDNQQSKENQENDNTKNKKTGE